MVQHHSRDVGEAEGGGCPDHQSCWQDAETLLEPPHDLGGTQASVSHAPPSTTTTAVFYRMTLMFVQTSVFLMLNHIISLVTSKREYSVIDFQLKQLFTG